MELYLLSLALAAVLGFAAHRASLCTVRAVSEILTSGGAYCLKSFAKTAAWVLALIFPVLAVHPQFAAHLTGISLSWGTLIGGLLFGIGAALNGGCSFSTLSRLADGQMRMLGKRPAGAALCQGRR